MTTHDLRSPSRAPALLPLLVAASLTAAPAAAQELPTLEPEEYGKWESLGSYQLDPTGTWLVASIRRTDESEELRLHRADGSGDPLVLEHASGAVLSGDGRWMAFRQGVSPDEEEDAEEPVQDRLGLVDLDQQTDTVLFEVASFSFRDDGAWMAARRPSPADSVGADLIVFRPGSDLLTTLGNVEDFAWQDDGSLLAATLLTASGDANGIVLFDPGTGALRTLDSRAARYRALSWGEENARLAVLRSVEDEGREDESHDLLLWNDVASASDDVLVLEARGRDDLPDSLRVVEHDGIEWSDDGSTVFVGLQPWEPAESEDEQTAGGDESEGQPDAGDPGVDGGEEAATDGEQPEDEVDPADVQVWHWNDDLIFRAQEFRSAARARRTFLAAWHPEEDRLVVLGSDLDEPVRVVAGGRWGIVPDYDPYLFERRFGVRTADWYRIDPRTGERAPVGEALEHGVQAGPDGTHALVFRDDAWHAVDLETLAWTTVRPAEGEAQPAFRRSLEDYDFPGVRPPWGIAGWMEGGRTALLEDEHDLWRADLEAGTLERLTFGAEEGVSYRALNLDPEHSFFSPRPLDPSEPLWMSAFDLTNKTAGFAVHDGEELRRPVWEGAAIGGLVKARDADLYAFRKERWDDSPDVFVAGPGLDDPVQVTETNPFQDDYAWGRTELLHYTTDAGHDLQAVLVYPADFEEGERYPLILYQYERLSSRLHAYDTPNERSYYDNQTWSQQGYFVLMPDIVYEPGRPGPSALDAVEHALDAALATGHVDPERMGLIGHSWGGYQASYLPTRTDRFAAAVAGAAITDFISFPGTVHWRGGVPEFGHWETGQARMAVPPWEDLEGHLESSPIHEIDQLETPVLLMHGDDDGVVDFRQGLQYYNYARRAGKPVVMLVYPGAGHGLSEESQQVDYHRRILEWFGHFLKGEEPARWIVEGESWEEREKRMEKGGFASFPSEPPTPVTVTAKRAPRSATEVPPDDAHPSSIDPEVRMR